MSNKKMNRIVRNKSSDKIRRGTKKAVCDKCAALSSTQNSAQSVSNNETHTTTNSYHTRIGTGIDYTTKSPNMTVYSSLTGRKSILDTKYYP
jgi:hypothetical protein